MRLNANGSIVAIGTQFNDGNGASSGHVRVFENTTLSTTKFTNNSISSYPNPTNDIVNFTSTEIIENITIYNLLGQEVFSKKINLNGFNINISNQPAGTYIAKMNSNGKIKSLKLVKL